jgi:hypothetical protein
MTQYQKYLKSWTSERGITSFLGSDKPAFQQDWKEEKKGLRFGEMESMGGEDINRAGEPFKKPVAKKSKKSMQEILAEQVELKRQKEELKKPIPIELIKADVKALPPISTTKQEKFKKFTNLIGSKEFNDTIEEAIKDMYYDQLGGLFPREKIYKDKFLTLSQKNQDSIRATVRAKLMKDLSK